MPLNSSVDATTRFQVGQRFGHARSSIGRLVSCDEVTELDDLERRDGARLSQ